MEAGQDLRLALRDVERRAIRLSDARDDVHDREREQPDHVPAERPARLLFEKLPDGDLGNRLSAVEYVKQIKEKGGIGFLAHPHEVRKHLREHPTYPWTAWESEDFTGIEIWNHMSEWAEGLNESNKLQRFIHPLKSIFAPPDVTLKKWDELNEKRKVVALGGIDAHAHKHNIMGIIFEIFAYKILFKSIRTHVFVDYEIKKGDAGNFESDKTQIIDALGKGRSFIVNNYYGSGTGFRFVAEYDDEQYTLGDEIKFDKSKNKKIIFRTFLPSQAKLAPVLCIGGALAERSMATHSS